MSHTTPYRFFQLGVYHVDDEGALRVVLYRDLSAGWAAVPAVVCTIAIVASVISTITPTHAHAHGGSLIGAHVSFVLRVQSPAE